MPTATDEKPRLDGLICAHFAMGRPSAWPDTEGRSIRRLHWVYQFSGKNRPLTRTRDEY